MPFRKLSKRLRVLLLVTALLVAPLAYGAQRAYAAATGGVTSSSAGLGREAFSSITISKADTGEHVADLTKGEVPKLHAGTTYALNVHYSLPNSLLTPEGDRYKPTYLNIWFGNGLYVKALPGATFNEGPISNTSFSELVKAPTGTGTAPYGYPQAFISQDQLALTPLQRSGLLTFKTVDVLSDVSTDREILFAVDQAFENSDANQTVADLIKVGLSTSPTAPEFNYASAVCLADTPLYGFWAEPNSEVLSKGGTTRKLRASNTGEKSLTKAGSKTTVELVYPKGVVLESLDETAVYKKPGTVVKTVEEGDNKVATIEWDDPGSFSGGLAYFPRITVPADSPLPNGSEFRITLRNLNKSIWNEETGRYSTGSAVMTVQVIDGDVPEKVTAGSLTETASNWAYKKYDTYNTRLGAMWVKNELESPSLPRTLEMDIDQNKTAIIRGVTIPYKEGMEIGPIHWTSSDGKSGIADPSVLRKDSPGALLTNKALGLDINTSITSIKVDLGPIPGNYYSKPSISDYFGWYTVPVGVFGSWKQGTNADVVTHVKFYRTGTTPGTTPTQDGKGFEKDEFDLVTKSGNPIVFSGLGNINKQQIMRGESFKISGDIDHINWTMNPLQDPVIYIFMPKGFSYAGLKITGGELGSPEHVGQFDITDKAGEPSFVNVYRYPVNIGDQTRGVYLPDFGRMAMTVEMTVYSSVEAAKGHYGINEFFGFTTTDFADVGAVNRLQKWYGANGLTTEAYAAAFGQSVNDGNRMVSLGNDKSEKNSIQVGNALGESAVTRMTVDYKLTGRSVTYPSIEHPGTIPVLQRRDKATINIAVRNNTTSEASRSEVFVPLLSEASIDSPINFGSAFMPGPAKLPFDFVSAAADGASGFKVSYIKLKKSAFASGTAPAPNEYEVVASPEGADMVLFSSDSLKAGQDASLSLTFRVKDNLDSSYNELVDTITPVHTFDLEGNKSTVSLRPFSLSYAGTDVILTKEWDDENNKDGKRPDIDTFASMLELTNDKGVKIPGVDPDKKVKDDNTYVISYLGLPRYLERSDKPITYTLSEKKLVSTDDAVYVTEKDFIRGFGEKVEGTIKNTYKVVKVTPSVEKKIEGEGPAEPDTFSFELTPQGNAPMPKEGVQDGKKVITIKGEGAADFGDILFNKEGTYVYEVKELAGEADCSYDDSVYTLTYEVKTKDGKLVAEALITKDGQAAQDVTFTNAYNTSVSFSKKWNDDNNRDGLRPESVEVQVLANGKPYGDPYVLNEENGWAGKAANLPKKIDGADALYTIKEVAVPAGYQSAITGDAATGFTITNTHQSEKVSVSVSKSWVGPKRGAVKVQLQADGQPLGDPVSLSDGNSWRNAWNDLYKYEGGKAITYGVVELDVPEGYESKVTGDAGSGFVITNTNVEKTSLSGTKTWNDDNNRDGLRPDAITVNLLANGEKSASQKVTEADGWKYSFTELPKYDEQGQEIAYSVTEDAVPNYATAVSGTDITNSYTPGKTSVTVSKVWDDDANRDGVRPESVQAQLFADGVPAGDPVTLSEANGWTYIWTGLFQKESGKDVLYTVEEVETPEGYRSAVAGDAREGFTITNTHEIEKRDIVVTKKWDGPEAGPVVARLLADGDETPETVTLRANDGWAAAFTGLPKFRDGGTEIKYGVEEVGNPAGYDVAVTGDAEQGFTITNTYNPEPTRHDPPVTKVVLGPAPESPDTFRFVLTATDPANPMPEGSEGAKKTVVVEGAGSTEFGDIVFTKPGTYAYTIAELKGDAVCSYDEAVYEVTYTVTDDGQGRLQAERSIKKVANDKSQPADGVVFTNTYPETSVQVTKEWVGAKGAEVTIRLIADGKETGEALVLNEANGWKGSFEHLARLHKDGTAVEYSISEDAVAGYETKVSGNAKDGFVVTNTEVVRPSTPAAPAAPNVPDTGEAAGSLGPLFAIGALGVLALAASRRLRRN